MDDILDRRDFLVADGLMQTRVKDELILLHPAREEYFGLNELGTILFDAARKNEDLRALAASVSENGGVLAEQVESDFRKLLQDLLDQDILSTP